MPKLREKDSRYFLLGTVASEDDKQIRGSRLPTVKQVLLCFLAHHSDADVKIREAANATIQTVQPFYSRARVPMLAPQKMAEEVEKLFQEMNELLKITVNVRENGKNKTKILNFKDKLETTMKFWPRNALERIHNEEDRQFLISMMGDREACMGVEDTLLSSTEKKVAERIQAEEKRKKKEELRIEENEMSSPVPGASADFEEKVNDEDQDYLSITPLTSRSHKRVVKVGMPGYWDHDVLKHPAVVESAVRNKLTPTALSDIAHSFIAATKGDPAKVTLHYSSVYRYYILLYNTFFELPKKIRY